MNRTTRAVVDTDVLIRTFLQAVITRPRSPYRELISIFYAHEAEIAYCERTRNELQQMLTASHLTRKYSINSDDAHEFIASLFYDHGVFIEISGEVHVSSDPKDDPFVETAIVAEATYLVVEDSDLREPAVVALCAEHGIKIVDPASFVAEFRDQRGSS